MPKTHYPTKPDKGFALVVTISLMVLLAVVCVGLLGLSAVSLRSTSQAQANSEAKANARLALILAIGELQKQMGPDQRVSASGAILKDTNVNHPRWTGAWDKKAIRDTGPSTTNGSTNRSMPPSWCGWPPVLL
jgi:Tfp pilus assembly protein PilX